jgi:hypothetical protein
MVSTLPTKLYTLIWKRWKTEAIKMEVGNVNYNLFYADFLNGSVRGLSKHKSNSSKRWAI